MPESEVSLQGPPQPEPFHPPSLSPRGHLLPGYAELHCLTNFSFQRGASHPEELVKRAYKLGYAALAITDECSVAGVVRAHVARRDLEKFLEEYEARHPEEGPLRRPDFRILYGSEFAFEGFTLVALARDREGWAGLCEFISAARLNTDQKAADRIEKGSYRVDWETSPLTLLQGCEILCVPDREPGVAIDSVALNRALERCAARFTSQTWLAVELLRDADDELWLAALREAGARHGVPLVAAGGVQMDARSAKRLHDVITAVREGRTVAECGFALQRNGERHLRQRFTLGDLYPADLLANTLEVMRRCTFRLEELQYNYPREPVPPGFTPMGALTRFTFRGARWRYPNGLPEKHREQIRKELRLIAFKRYEMFFLTVYDVVRYAREQKILYQGRGSAANSLVCYCLGITEISPEFANMLFERFISKERNEPPDIDVDFEHQRREEVIQYIYRKYGRERAAIAAVVVRYRSRMAIRDVGKALGIPEKLIDVFAKDHHWFDEDIAADHLKRVVELLGMDESDSRLVHWLELARELRGFPRHLSQHVGGFVLTDDKLTRLVPIENASMPERSIIQWEKDDIDSMKLLKVDVLALGMLSALRRCLQFQNALRGRDWGLHDIPREDPRVYDMICKADTVGVFQVESRAQMSMLPRLLPRNYYDLVVEVAIVRPGPIQGGMVHPYLKARKRRREGKEIFYIKDELEEPLGRTLGVPIFQEQVMQLAMVAAKFTADEADALRRSMAAWSRKGGVYRFKEPLVEGMVKNGYPRQFAEGIFKQIEGFGEYGFPESHAASFALLVYFSCWFKHHEPACFLAGLLNAQPMGFYTPAQLVQDAQRHHIEVRPVDVTLSDYDCTLESLPSLPVPCHPERSEGSLSEAPHPPHPLPQPAIRLGLRIAGTLSEEGAKRIVAARTQSPFTGVEDLALRADLDLKDMNALAAADALSGLSGHRRQQVWQAAAQRRAPGVLRHAPVNEDLLRLPPGKEGDDIVFDYASTGLTLRRHPLALLREKLAGMDILSSRQMRPMPHGQLVRGCGIVSVRQRPPTAKGTVFVTLEDETGTVNVIVWNRIANQQRDPLMRARLLMVEGLWQRDVESGGNVRHLLAQQLEDLTPLLGRLGEQTSQSRDFH